MVTLLILTYINSDKKVIVGEFVTTKMIILLNAMSMH